MSTGSVCLIRSGGCGLICHLLINLCLICSGMSQKFRNPQDPSNNYWSFVGSVVRYAHMPGRFKRVHTCRRWDCRRSRHFFPLFSLVKAAVIFASLANNRRRTNWSLSKSKRHFCFLPCWDLSNVIGVLEYLVLLQTKSSQVQGPCMHDIHQKNSICTSP